MHPSRALPAGFCLFLLSCGLAGASDPGAAMPRAFGAGDLFRSSEEFKVFTAETMYEHVDGEAELFKRFGATRLVYGLYEGPVRTSVTVDAVELGSPENAFGLYRLYTGCEEDTREEAVDQGRFYASDSTAFAWVGTSFLRVNAADSPEPLAVFRGFLTAFAQKTTPAVPLPGYVAELERAARRPCDVRYFPDFVDPALEVGPGYRWVTPGGKTAFLLQRSSAAEGAALAGELAGKTGRPCRALGRFVVLPKDGGEKEMAELEHLLAALKTHAD